MPTFKSLGELLHSALLKAGCWLRGGVNLAGTGSKYRSGNDHLQRPWHWQTPNLRLGSYYPSQFGGWTDSADYGPSRRPPTVNSGSSRTNQLSWFATHPQNPNQLSQSPTRSELTGIRTGFILGGGCMMAHWRQKIHGLLKGPLPGNVQCETLDTSII